MTSEQAADAAHDSAADQHVVESATAGLRLGGEFAQLRYATIMMIDDEPVAVETVQAFLQVSGYRKFIKVEDPRQALDKVHEHRPDLLLLGMATAGGVAFDILQSLRADANLSHIPVILLTSRLDPAVRLQALDLGATELLAKPVDAIELTLRVRNTLAARAYQDQLAYYDGLTGLPNPRLFQDRVDSAIARAQRERGRVALLHVKFDGFERVIDTLGPKVADEVLKLLAKRLAAKFRASDTVSLDAPLDEVRGDVFRLRRAEFSVLLPSVDSVVGTAAVGQRILAAMSEPLKIDATEVGLKPSIGVSGFPDDADDAATLIKLAAGASSQAITHGGERLQFFSSAMNDAARQWLRMEADLRRAVTAGELRLLYQPKIDVSSGAVVGAEALMRWPRTDGIIVSPSDFISVAEQTGMILPIGEWALREACRQAVSWREQGVDIKIAVNISAPQFFEAGLVPLVRTILDETGLGPGMLTLEITERIVIDRVSQALAILAELRDVGVEISIDDFGTGYASLSYLKRFTADEVKIDRSLVADVADSRNDRALVYAVTYLAHQLGFRVCAEGVERAEQLKFLHKIKCDQYQGFLFNRPLDPKTFVEQYRERQGKLPSSGR